MFTTEENYSAKVPELREHFFSKYAEQVAASDYDQADLDRIRSDDMYTECFLRSAGAEDLDPPAEKINTVLKHRKEFGANNIKVEELPKEITSADALIWKGEDLMGHKVLIFKVVKHKKGSFVEDMKRFIYYTLDQHQRAHTTERIVLIFDFTGAGVSNVDLDVTKFIIACLTSYFPCLLHVILLFEMPFLLSAVWKVISSWLSAEQKTYIKQVKKADMPKYIAVDQLEAHMVKK